MKKAPFYTIEMIDNMQQNIYSIHFISGDNIKGNNPKNKRKKVDLCKDWTPTATMVVPEYIVERAGNMNMHPHSL